MNGINLDSGMVGAYQNAIRMKQANQNRNQDLIIGGIGAGAQGLVQAQERSKRDAEEAKHMEAVKSLAIKSYGFAPDDPVLNDPVALAAEIDRRHKDAGVKNHQEFMQSQQDRGFGQQLALNAIGNEQDIAQEGRAETAAAADRTRFTDTLAATGPKLGFDPNMPAIPNLPPFAMRSQNREELAKSLGGIKGGPDTAVAGQALKSVDKGFPDYGEKIDDALGRQYKRAQIAKTQAEAVPSAPPPRNIDPNSPEGIAAAAARRKAELGVDKEMGAGDFRPRTETADPNARVDAIERLKRKMSVPEQTEFERLFVAAKQGPFGTAPTPASVQEFKTFVESMAQKYPDAPAAGPAQGGGGQPPGDPAKVKALQDAGKKWDGKRWLNADGSPM